MITVAALNRATPIPSHSRSIHRSGRWLSTRYLCTTALAPAERAGGSAHEVFEGARSCSSSSPCVICVSLSVTTAANSIVCSVTLSRR